MFKYLIVLIAASFTACSQDPQPIHYGHDACHGCKMTILDEKFGAEIISTKGKIYKFDDLICMVAFLKSGQISPDNISRKVIENYNKKNDFLDAEMAVYFKSSALHSPMNGNTAAFSDSQEARKFQDQQAGEILDWNGLYKTFK